MRNHTCHGRHQSPVDDPARFLVEGLHLTLAEATEGLEPVLDLCCCITRAMLDLYLSSVCLGLFVEVRHCVVCLPKLLVDTWKTRQTCLRVIQRLMNEDLVPREKSQHFIHDGGVPQAQTSQKFLRKCC